MNFSSVKKALEELQCLLMQLSDEEYAKPIANLSNASIGQHTRHIIELLQCLLYAYTTGNLNYDHRERNKVIEKNSSYASQAIDTIISGCEKENKPLQLHQCIDGHTIHIETNYYRELLYNLEHCIHHQALIKVALFAIENVTVHENFGVAQSTIDYKKQCAQ